MTFWKTVEQGRGFLEVGGPVVAVLLVMSIFALAVVLLKLHQFRRCRVRDRQPVHEALRLHRSGDSVQALKVLDRTANPVASVMALAIRGRRRRDLDAAAVREEAARVAADGLFMLRAWLRPLEVIASLAPLMGLFGTVLGMIEAFRQLEQAGARVDPSILSGGIWEALLTTAVGLAVAIPTVVALNWFEHVVDAVANDMECSLAGVFAPDIASEAVDADVATIPENAPSHGSA